MGYFIWLIPIYPRLCIFISGPKFLVLVIFFWSREGGLSETLEKLRVFKDLDTEIKNDHFWFSNPRKRVPLFRGKKWSFFRRQVIFGISKIGDSRCFYSFLRQNEQKLALGLQNSIFAGIGSWSQGFGEIFGSRRFGAGVCEKSAALR